MEARHWNAMNKWFAVESSNEYNIGFWHFLKSWAISARILSTDFVPGGFLESVRSR